MSFYVHTYNDTIKDKKESSAGKIFINITYRLEEEETPDNSLNHSQNFYTLREG